MSFFAFSVGEKSRFLRLVIAVRAVTMVGTIAAFVLLGRISAAVVRLGRVSAAVVHVLTVFVLRVIRVVRLVVVSVFHIFLSFHKWALHSKSQSVETAFCSVRISPLHRVSAIPHSLVPPCRADKF